MTTQPNFAIDWMQFRLHGGEPCFNRDKDGSFCGRAKEWHSDHTHEFISLPDLLSRQHQRIEELEAASRENRNWFEALKADYDKLLEASKVALEALDMRPSEEYVATAIAKLREVL